MDKNFLPDLIRGWLAPLRALRFLFRNKKAFRYTLMPLLINIAITFFSLFAAFVLIPSPFTPEYPDFSLTLRFFIDFFSAFFFSAGNLFFHFSAFLTSYFLGFSLLCSVFYGIMTEKIETMLGLDPQENNPLPLGWQALDSLILSLIFLFGNLFLIFFGFFPILGPILSISISFLFQSLCLGIEFFDFSLSIRGLSLKQKYDYLKKHPGLVLGVGNISLVFLWIPILNSCLFTLSILGATFIYRDQRIFAKLKSLCPSLEWSPLSKGDEVLTSTAKLTKEQNQPLLPVYMASSKEHSRILVFTHNQILFEKETEELEKLIKQS